jgi:tryptophan synthase alpha chain
MARPSVAEALARRRAEGEGSLALYLLVDRARRGRVAAWARAAAEAGADALELGFPFSDPVADGPELEAAHARSLAHGTRWGDLLEALDAAADRIPCAVMSYANPIWHRGLDAAAAELRAHGASALVIPDLSYEDGRREWTHAFRSKDLALVRFASPATPPDRLQRLARASEAFLYLVSHYGTTGSGTADGSVRDLGPLLALSHRVRPRLPVLIGFGVRSREDAARWRARGADGVVVGSAFERRLGRGATPSDVDRFVRWLARGVRGPVRRTPPARS